jgi:Protein of unknown function (DUF3500)
MSENLQPYCPECEEHVAEPQVLDRRNFIRVVGESAAVLAVAGTAAATVRADEVKPKTATDKQAEDLVKELYSTLSEEQKKNIVLPWDHGAVKGKVTATRMRMYNGPIMNKRIGDNYTKAQQELIQKILRGICSDEDGYRRITRNGTYDGSRAFEQCGAMVFGEAVDGKDKLWAWVFTGHHLTVRCDGDSEPGAAFGGPMYYGHSPNGYSDRNVFNYQTKSVLSVWDALSEKQRQQAEVKGSPGEQEPSVRFRKKSDPKPGIGIGELTKDQQALVEKVMRDVLSPYRKQDVDEVMQIIKTTGGMEKINLAFYQDGRARDNERWHFWRLEGPGFVWNYRVLPHVHTYVNISSMV